VSAFAPREAVPLAPLTTLGVGGAARWFAAASVAADVANAYQWCRQRGVPLWVLGGGSNVVVADGGVDGLVLHVAITGVHAQEDAGGLLVDAGAGESWDALVGRLVADGWAGVECLSGIPGTVGGTPIQNVGAYGQEVASVIEAVDLFDGDSGEAGTLDGAACGFSYRTSRFKGEDAGRFVICRVRLRLRRGTATTTYPDVLRWLQHRGVTQPEAGDVRDAVLAIRRAKGMVVDGVDPDARSVGSFFMNPVIPAAERDRLASLTGADVPARPADGGAFRVPAAWLIERAGWTRGEAHGPVGISGKHPLAIVNRGGARAADVVSFAARVKRRVADQLGVWLQPEPVFVGFDGGDAVPDLEYLRKAHP
jgi:UDP-N-acetylmuramate dehydrogenase